MVSRLFFRPVNCCGKTFWWECFRRTRISRKNDWRTAIVYWNNSKL